MASKIYPPFHFSGLHFRANHRKESRSPISVAVLIMLAWKHPQKTNMLNPKMKIWKKFSPFLMGIVYSQVPPIRFRGGVCCLICLIQVRIDHRSPRHPRILRRLEDFRPHKTSLRDQKISFISICSHQNIICNT